MEAQLTGPGIWFINIVGILSLVMAVFVSVDAWRDVRAELLPDTKTKLIWVAPQAAFVVAMAAVMIPGLVPGEYRWVVLAVTPVAAILQVSYLLKVVFPKQEGDTDTSQAAHADRPRDS